MRLLLTPSHVLGECYQSGCLAPVEPHSCLGPLLRAPQSHVRPQEPMYRVRLSGLLEPLRLRCRRPHSKGLYSKLTCNLGEKGSSSIDCVCACPCTHAGLSIPDGTDTSQLVIAVDSERAFDRKVCSQQTDRTAIYLASTLALARPAPRPAALTATCSSGATNGYILKSDT